MFLLVPAYPGCPGSKAVKRSLLNGRCLVFGVDKAVSSNLVHSALGWEKLDNLD